MITRVVFEKLPYHLEHHLGDSFPLIPVGTVIEWDLSFVDRENPKKVRQILGPRTIRATKLVYSTKDGLVQYLTVD